MEMRGPGQFFGTKQSGLPGLKVARLTDVKLIELTRERSERMLDEDSGLTAARAPRPQPAGRAPCSIRRRRRALAIAYAGQSLSCLRPPIASHEHESPTHGRRTHSQPSLHHRQRREAALRPPGRGEPLLPHPRLARLLVRVAPEHRAAGAALRRHRARTCAATRTPTSRSCRRRRATPTPSTPRTSRRSSTSTTSTRCASSPTTSARSGCRSSRGCTRSALHKLMLFDPPYPGIGARWFQLPHTLHTWYQLFHQLPLAEELVGSSPKATEIYLRHFLSAWSHDKDLWTDDEIAAYVEAYSQPGALRGGFNCYRAALSRRRLQRGRHAEGDDADARPLGRRATRSSRSTGPTISATFFENFELKKIEDVGHFMMREAPDRINAEILDWMKTDASAIGAFAPLGVEHGSRTQGQSRHRHRRLARHRQGDRARSRGRGRGHRARRPRRGRACAPPSRRSRGARRAHRRDRPPTSQSPPMSSAWCAETRRAARAHRHPREQRRRLASRTTTTAGTSAYQREHRGGRARRRAPSCRTCASRAAARSSTSPSIWGREAGGGLPYNAMKAAMISHAKNSALTLAKDNIRVNSVAPGSIRHPGGSWDRRANEDPDGHGEVRARTTSRWAASARPEEVAQRRRLPLLAARIVGHRRLHQRRRRPDQEQHLDAGEECRCLIAHVYAAALARRTGTASAPARRTPSSASIDGPLPVFVARGECRNARARDRRTCGSRSATRRPRTRAR